MQRSYEYTHIVSFEETNLVGNVYYANHIKWQGRVREMFLKDHAPEMLTQLSEGLALATLKCSCEYFAELWAFDEITIRMRLGEQVQNRITMLFEYWRTNNDKEELVAKGEQQVACLMRTEKETIPTPVPKKLLDALRPFS